MQSFTSETEDRRRGAVLGMVLVVVVLVSVLGGGLLYYTASVAAEVGRQVSAAQAFWTAEAGLQSLLAIGRAAQKPLEEIDLVKNGWAGSVLRGNYTVTYTVLPGGSPFANRLRLYHIESHGEAAGGQEVVVEVNADLPTFNQYMMFSNIGVTPDDQPVYFGDGDTIAGPVYANDQLNIWHDHPQNPIFVFPSPLGDEWLIMSAADSVNMHAGDLTVFEDDGSMYPDGQPQSRLRLDQPEVSIDPIQEFFDDSKSAAQSGSPLSNLSGNYDMTFHDDGSVVYEQRGGSEGPKTNTIEEFGGAIYVNGDVYISGVVDGDLTLVVEHGIHIDGDVVYESAQSPDPWTGGFDADTVDDFLTLLTPEYVRLESQPGSKADGRTMHASIYVTEDNPGDYYGLCAADWDRNIGKPKLNLFGGVTQYRRGLLARPPNVTASGTSPQPFGYGKNFFYDERMASRAGPYTSYLVSGWEYR
ncbi:MAG: hypothetical protein ISS31_00655 [Kiritimatiellae bacterium]|nr:hypothetical protein [Kiritimatiellia bacterium]